MPVGKSAAFTRFQVRSRLSDRPSTRRSFWSSNPATTSLSRTTRPIPRASSFSAVSPWTVTGTSGGTSFPLPRNASSRPRKTGSRAASTRFLGMRRNSSLSRTGPVHRTEQVPVKIARCREPAQSGSLFCSLSQMRRISREIQRVSVCFGGTTLAFVSRSRQIKPRSDKNSRASRPFASGRDFTFASDLARRNAKQRRA